MKLRFDNALGDSDKDEDERKKKKKKKRKPQRGGTDYFDKKKNKRYRDLLDEAGDI